MKIIHLPTAVGGNPSGLSQSFNLLGIKSECWILAENRFSYPVDGIISKSKTLLKFEWDRLLFFFKILKNFDIVHYNFGMTLYQRPISTILSPEIKKLPFSVFKNTLYFFYVLFMEKLESALLRACGKKLFVHYQGDDARMGNPGHYQVGPSLQKAMLGKGYYSYRGDCYKKRKIRLLSRKCTGIYCVNPDLKDFLPKKTKFIPYSHVCLENFKPNFIACNETPFRIGHAPSHRGVKGTEHILGALNKLIEHGHNIEIVLIENMNNQDAIEVYKTLDLLIDQLFAGWYGGLAVECMALGKPVISYIRENDLRHIPREMADDLPVISATSETIEIVLQNCISLGKENLLLLGKKSRAYVEKWHDPVKIAREILIDYSIANQPKSNLLQLPKVL